MIFQIHLITLIFSINFKISQLTFLKEVLIVKKNILKITEIEREKQ